MNQIKEKKKNKKKFPSSLKVFVRYSKKVRRKCVHDVSEETCSVLMKMFQKRNRTIFSSCHIFSPFHCTSVCVPVFVNPCRKKTDHPNKCWTR